MTLSWLCGFAIGGLLGFVHQQHVAFFESDPLFLSGLSLTTLKVLTASAVLGVYATIKPAMWQRLFVFSLAAFFSFRHFSANYEESILSAAPIVLQGIRDQGIRYLQSEDKMLAGWIDSLVWGESQSISNDLRESFRISGLYHILSVSGSHITTLFVLLRLVCLAPLQLLYAAYLIPGPIWFTLRSIVPLASIPVLLAYLEVIGSPQAAARATFIAIIHQLLQWFFTNLSTLQRIQFTLCLQTYLVPEGFFSSGNLMSWVGYLCIVELSFSKTGENSFFNWIFFKRLLAMQCELIAWAVVCFGQLSLIGIPANFILAPIFAPVFWGAIGLAICPQVAMLTPAPLIQHWFISSVKISASFASIWTWLYLKNDQMPNSLRLICASACSILLVKRVRSFALRR